MSATHRGTALALCPSPSVCVPVASSTVGGIVPFEGGERGPGFLHEFMQGVGRREGGGTRGIDTLGRKIAMGYGKGARRRRNEAHVRRRVGPRRPMQERPHVQEQTDGCMDGWMPRQRRRTTEKKEGSTCHPDTHPRSDGEPCHSHRRTEASS